MIKNDKSGRGEKEILLQIFIVNLEMISFYNCSDIYQSEGAVKVDGGNPDILNCQSHSGQTADISPAGPCEENVLNFSHFEFIFMGYSL